MLLQVSVNGMDGYLVPFLLLLLLIWSIALVSIANGLFSDNTTKLCWFLIVLFLNVFGVLLFILWGRKEIQYEKKVPGNEG